jgi:branched-chain amino acid transport system substrate-binding protein
MAGGPGVERKGPSAEPADKKREENMKNTWKTLLGAALLSTVMPLAAAAQGGPLKILVLDDMSGIFAANGGPGTLLAVQMAVEDAGGKVLGRPIEILQADHQNKPDVGSAQAQRYIQEQGFVQ